MKKVGNTWLQKNLNIQGFKLTHESYIGTTDKIEVSATNTVIRTFKPKYDVGSDEPMTHLEFSLKYDDLNLAFISEVFKSCEQQTISNYINANPNRKHPRIIGFLYEFTQDTQIEATVTTTNYEDVLDSIRYLTGDIRKIS